MNKILLVEDDENIAFMLADGLENEGFEIIYITHAEEVVNYYLQEKPDILLMDVNLNGKLNGFDATRMIREYSSVPVIFTTSRTGSKDLKEGFKIGNVDYLKKPYSITELVLRIRELLKRNSSASSLSSAILLGEAEFDPHEQTLKIKGRSLHLPHNESKTLEILCRNKNQLLEKSLLISQVWGEKYTLLREASLNNVISSLRTKLSGEKSVTISTIPKKGYKLILR